MQIKPLSFSNFFYKNYIWHHFRVAPGPPSPQSGHGFSGRGHRRVTAASGYTRSPPFSCHRVVAVTEVKIKEGGRRLAPPFLHPQRKGGCGGTTDSRHLKGPVTQRERWAMKRHLHISARVEWDTLPVLNLSLLFWTNTHRRHCGSVLCLCVAYVNLPWHTEFWKRWRRWFQFLCMTTQCICKK